MVPCGAYVYTYLLKLSYLFLRTMNNVQFNYYICHNYSRFWVKLLYFFVKKCTFCVKYLTPWGASYRHTSWGNGFYFEERYYPSISIWLCYDYSIFWHSKCHIFVKIYLGIYFEELLILFNFNDFCCDYSRFWGSNWHIVGKKRIMHKVKHLTPWGAYV